jgi:gamma-glutamyltranspeptidase/glutathione hydrolase
MSGLRRSLVLATTSAVAAALVAVPGAPVSAQAGTPPKQPAATGFGGAVATVDADATAVGIDVLRHGGNAADAAVATAAALGVTEPYSSGIGGGGFFVYYDARTRRVSTIDGRETAPATFTPTVFTNPDGTPLTFADVVSSGLSVGVPGTPAVWDEAARRFGTRRLGSLLAPAESLASRGFVVDAAYQSQTAANADRFRLFPETERVFLPGGEVPAVGSTVRNPDLARAYAGLRRYGVEWLYRGGLGRAFVDAARNPRTRPDVTVYPGQLTTGDLAAYRVRTPAPTHGRYRGLDVYGMPVPSSGGIAVGEALNLLEAYDRQTGVALRDADRVQYLHRLAEASATAFADRNRWVGSVPGVPERELLSQRYADRRACALFDPVAAHARPIPFGSPGSEPACGGGSAAQAAAADDHGTTHLTVADRWGNVAAYTLTIEQTGGSGMTVPGYGFLLNNELTDFNFVPLAAGVPDPNLPGPGKRPRSSMSPTILLAHGRPWLALGSPGGASIITTVLQTLAGYVDRGLPLVDAIAEPRLSSRNGPRSEAEPAILNGPDGAALTALGHVLVQNPPTGGNPDIGAATAIRLHAGGRLDAAAEPTRRGGGSAAVVAPAP